MIKTRRDLVLRLISAWLMSGAPASFRREAWSDEGEPASGARLRTRRIEGSAMAPGARRCRCRNHGELELTTDIVVVNGGLVVIKQIISRASSTPPERPQIGR